MFCNPFEGLRAKIIVFGVFEKLLSREADCREVPLGFGLAQAACVARSQIHAKYPESCFTSDTPKTVRILRG